MDYLPDQLGDDDEMPAALVQAYMRNTSDALAAVEVCGALSFPGVHAHRNWLRRGRGFMAEDSHVQHDEHWLL